VAISTFFLVRSQRSASNDIFPMRLPRSLRPPAITYNHAALGQCQFSWKKNAITIREAINFCADYGIFSILYGYFFSLSSLLLPGLVITNMSKPKAPQITQDIKSLFIVTSKKLYSAQSWLIHPLFCIFKFPRQKHLRFLFGPKLLNLILSFSFDYCKK